MLSLTASCSLIASSLVAATSVEPVHPIAWHPVTLTFVGPAATERDTAPNPFLDFRLQVVFSAPDGQRYDVPGFFDGDGLGGRAAAHGALRFAPSSAGTWHYRASLHAGPGVAIDLAPEAGQPVELADAVGQFEVAPRDVSAPGFLKWGRLNYVGEHYLKFQDGPYWLRGGTDEPEDFLGYAGFDRTPPKHRYAGHVADWRRVIPIGTTAPVVASSARSTTWPLST